MKKEAKNEKKVVGADAEVVDMELLKEVLGGLAPGGALPDPRLPGRPPRFLAPSANETWQ